MLLGFVLAQLRSFVVKLYGCAVVGSCVAVRLWSCLCSEMCSRVCAGAVCVLVQLCELVQ